MEAEEKDAKKGGGKGASNGSSAETSEESENAKKGGRKGASYDSSAETSEESGHCCRRAGCTIPRDARHFSYGSGADRMYMCPVSPVSVVCRGGEGQGSGRERGLHRL